MNFTVSDSFKKYFFNTSWMFFEKGVRFFSIFLVGIYIARYLGPEHFGTLSYALAIVSIFMALSKLGMESILVRELTSHANQMAEYTSTAFNLMLIGGITAFLIIAAIIIPIESTPIVKTCILIISSGLFLQAFLVFDYAFQAQTQAKLSSLAKSLGLFISASIKIALVLLEADLVWFAASFMFEHLFIASALFLIFKKKHYFHFRLKIDRQKARQLLHSAWPMVLSGIAGMILMKIDQVMIKAFLDSSQLGLYAAAIKIYEGWISFPFIFSIAMLPVIVKMKDNDNHSFEKYLTIMFSIALWSSVIFSLLITALSTSVIQLTFGREFMDASTTLSILIWASIPSSLGFMSARYLIANNLEKKIAKRNLIAITLNIPLNLILIPTYGIHGAAIATLASLICVHYFIDIFDNELSHLFKIKNKAIYLNFRNHEH